MFFVWLFLFQKKNIRHGETTCENFSTYRSELPLSLIIQRNLLITDIDAKKPKLKALIFSH